MGKNLINKLKHVHQQRGNIYLTNANNVIKNAKMASEMEGR